jgi:hypothetical protein
MSIIIAISGLFVAVVGLFFGIYQWYERKKIEEQKRKKELEEKKDKKKALLEIIFNDVNKIAIIFQQKRNIFNDISTDSWETCRELMPSFLCDNEKERTLCPNIIGFYNLVREYNAKVHGEREEIAQNLEAIAGGLVSRITNILEELGVKCTVDKSYNPICGINNDDILKYEDGFAKHLLRFIRSDSNLESFYKRLIRECENIQEVANSANIYTINTLRQKYLLMNEATSTLDISQFDGEFHHVLSLIAGDHQFYEWWKTHSMSRNRYLDNLWVSIGFGTEHHDILLKIHARILESIENKNFDGAVDAMQEHFALVLYNLLCKLYDSKNILDMQ